MHSKSIPNDDDPQYNNDIGNVAADQLRSYIQRIEKLEEEKADIAGFTKDVFAEIKANGYNVKAIKEILKLRKLEPQHREEQEYTVELYKKALGMSFEQPDLFEEPVKTLKEKAKEFHSSLAEKGMKVTGVNLDNRTVNIGAI